MAVEKVYGKDEIIGAINEFLEQHLHKITTGPREGYYTAEGTEFDEIRVHLFEYTVEIDSAVQSVEISLVDTRTNKIVNKEFKLNFYMNAYDIIWIGNKLYYNRIKEGHINVPAKSVYIRAEEEGGSPRLTVRNK